ncbi:flagellar filament capping protein FliD [Marinobacter caseinilyticus]|uniref:flagellar filament capping protein FliD n=1 Tax=Marinobacter caseinilyticus TaxID=2692195 RepID=UPI00140985B6|nr:flagellar filament capping protein FliD [Marinobacter caseinilyticus]
MAGISSLGIGSGVLSSDLVDQLVAAERKPTEFRLDFNQKRTEALISAYGTLRSAVTELRLPMRQLSAPDNLKAFSASSSNDDVAVTVDSSKANRGTYTVQVNSLAQSQSLASGTFLDKDATAVGTGSLTIQVGDQSQTISIDSTNNTLQGIANAINDADLGATAGVIDTGSGFRLVMSSEETGTANAISITANDTDGNNTDALGLSQFVFDGTTSNMTETVAAQDADLLVNGISITRSTNTIENVVDGLSFELTAENVTSIVKVNQDTDAVADRVQAFVDKFNGFQQVIKGLAGFNAESGQGGLLSGDSTVRNIQNQLRSVLTNIVPGLENASVRSLVDVGITTNFENGELKFDRAKFQEQLKNNPDDVTALFAEQGRTTDAQIEFVRSGVDSKPGEYAINITQLAARGSLLGANAGAADVLIDADNDDLTFRIDDTTTASIKLTAGSYTRDALAAEIQAQLSSNTALNSAGRSVSVVFDAGTGALSFTSGKYGGESNVSLTAVDTNSAALLGLSVQTGVAGQDVAGTIGGQLATGDGQVLFVDGSRGDAAGLQVRVTGGSVGARGALNFIEGIGEQTVNLVTNILGENSGLENRSDSLQKELDNIAQERVRLNQRIESYRERLVAQFSAADSLIAQLNSTRDYVTQQLAALAPQNNRDN